MTLTISWKPRDMKQIKREGQEHDQIKKWNGMEWNGKESKK